MHWMLFILVTVVSVLLVYPTFPFFERMSVRAGQIPPRGSTTWKGRPFLHLNDYLVLRYGDAVFLSLLNGFVITSIPQMVVGAHFTFVVIVSGILALVMTFLWIKNVRRSFTNGTLTRWDVGFTAPDATLTYFAKYHTFYFAFECFIALLAVWSLAWLPVAMLARIGIATCLLGYAVTMLYDAWNIGLYLGPFSKLLHKV